MQRLIAVLCIFAHLLAVFLVPARATVGAGVGCAFNAKNCGNIAQNAFLSAATNVLQAVGFNAIGDFKAENGFKNGDFVSTTLHAAIGGLGGAIMCGLKCAASGALGAALGEIATNFTSDFSLQTQRNISQILGGLGSFALGDSQMTGATSALNGFQYNFLWHQQREDLQKLLDKKQQLEARFAGEFTPDTAEWNEYRDVLAQIDSYHQLSLQNSTNLVNTCSSGASDECRAAIKELEDHVKSGELASFLNGATALPYRETADYKLYQAYKGVLDGTKTPQEAQKAYVFDVVNQMGKTNLAKGVVGGIGVGLGCAVSAGGVCVAMALTGGTLAANDIAKGWQQYNSGEQDAKISLENGLRELGLDEKQVARTIHLLEIGALVIDVGAAGYSVFKLTSKALSDASILEESTKVISEINKVEVNTAIIEGKTCVYSCVENGITRYVGITDDIARRGAEHLKQKNIIIDKIEGLSNLSRSDAHAVEQTLINYYGLEKDGGTLINKINSISPIKNPTAYEQALIRGKELLDKANYKW